MSEVQMTPDQIVEAMPQFLIPEKAGTTNATIAFDLSGADGGKWWVHIHDARAESGKGEPPSTPNLTLLAHEGFAYPAARRRAAGQTLNFQVGRREAISLSRSSVPERTSRMTTN